MKWYNSIALLGGISIASVITFGSILSSCNDYNITRPNLVSNSRPIGKILSGKIEYTKLKDGSEEIYIDAATFFVRNEKVRIYQNLDGDDKVDRIRVQSYKMRGVTALEDILIRNLDFDQYSKEFEEADKLLLQQREKYSK